LEVNMNEGRKFTEDKEKYLQAQNELHNFGIYGNPRPKYTHVLKRFVS